MLNLDVDLVVSLIGGWRDDFWATPAPARLLAVAMAQTHLRAGRDVVMPQLTTQPAEIEGFQAACGRTGAEYREIALVAQRQHALDRYAGRTADGGGPVDEIIARNGGRALLERIHDHLADYLAGRPDCVLVPTDGRDPEQTYATVLEVL